MVMHRSGLSLGYADKTVSQVCQEDGADCSTFLAIANFVTGRPTRDYRVSLQAMLDYLERTHSYLLDYMLPMLRRKLIECTDVLENHDVTFLLLKFFDDYVEEVSQHMAYEQNTIFAYVRELLAGHLRPGECISDYMKGHTSMVQKLKELKDIFQRHYHQKINNVLNTVLFDLTVCEKDLVSHCEIENQLFMPAVQQLEEELAHKPAPAAAEPDDLVTGLSDREKEIIRGVACGKANKEIADELHLSVHTVTTYRRNIISKLGIHSTAGLTIFAVLNGLVSLKDC